MSSSSLPEVELEARQRLSRRRSSHPKIEKIV
jgi:hypothetical protein